MARRKKTIEEEAQSIGLTICTPFPVSCLAGVAGLSNTSVMRNAHRVHRSKHECSSFRQSREFSHLSRISLLLYLSCADDSTDCFYLFGQRYYVFFFSCDRRRNLLIPAGAVRAKPKSHPPNNANGGPYGARGGTTPEDHAPQKIFA